MPSLSTLDDGLFIDIESVPGANIFALGATCGSSFREEANGIREIEKLISRVREVARSVPFIAGHNIIGHDLPVIESAFRVPELQRMPAIDTLYLSPIAFPRNPYHRLIKNDRLIRSSKNHPVRDCDSSKAILLDAIDVFSTELKTDRGRQRLALYRFLLGCAELPRNGSEGFNLLFSSLGVPVLSAAQAFTAWTELTENCTCSAAAQTEWDRARREPAHSASLAYVSAWLSVAGSDSVLPAWVRHRFPQTAAAIRNLRNTPCGNSQCAWCNEVQSPTKQLERFFGHKAFRPEPSVSGRPGVSLQEEMVRLAMGGRSLLGILPTGGGKSLCFQVPALHRYLTTGALTVVITPLQALMKDQVEGLIEKTSTTAAAALNGMLTPPEKAEVREAVRLGSVGILYVSPEQLRNVSFRRTILQREIGCWVFDEAHCLSQWGHDFRPDYVYIARFIRELAAEQLGTPPPVMCVTATAKDEVKQEIVLHFRDQLQQQLIVLDGGTNRENLSYRIERIPEQEKAVRIQALLSEKIADGIGAAVIFTATRKRAQEFAEFLCAPGRGWACAAFHAGLPAEEKKAILDDYLGGRLQVVVATNAFGMGIDKPNIRLVIHADTPGSLENYLQEAGRAGRDTQPAECVLLFSPEDLETQFGLLSLSRIEKRDIDQIWRAILRADHGDGSPVTLTVSEIVDGPMESVSFVEEAEEQRGTKVRTALAVLEKQGFLERDENHTKIFQARLLVANEEEALTKIARLDLPLKKQNLWMDVVGLLLSQSDSLVLSLDDFAELSRMKELYAQMSGGSYGRISPYAPVFRVLNEMAEPAVGLISKDLLYSARLRSGKTAPARTLLNKVTARERALVNALRDEEPSPDGWVPLSVRRVNQHLISEGHESLPKDVLRALRSLSSDGRKMGRPASLIEIGYGHRDHVPVRTSAPWPEVLELASIRHDAAGVLLEVLIAKAREKSGTDSAIVLVEFSEAELLQAFRSDLTLNLAMIRDIPAFIQYLLVYLHDNDVIELKNGKALMSQSMSLRVLESRNGKQSRRFTKGDYASLLVHYSEKVFQIHVMGEYTRIGIERIGAHLRLISAYFELGKDAFAARFLSESREVYERATGIESFRKIVDDLRNPVQQAIVAEPVGTNMLVLAGPGSGKSRVVAHRCAYLLRVERVRPERILVACFNRHAALELRRQIHDLVEKDAFGVMVQTYHGLAFRLLGRSLERSVKGDAPPDFDALLDEATALVTGTQVGDGVREDEGRDRILAGFSHILVDEYQDIDEREYAFISAIAGRREADEDRRLTIMAVGDDDQSIYQFKGANVEFIRRFQKDYNAQEHYLTENYRSTRAIIAAANTLIARNTDRMKVAHPIRINRVSAAEDLGGRWEQLDPVVRGKVQRVHVNDEIQQADFVASEIQRLAELGSCPNYSGFAVLARTHDVLMGIRAMLEEREIPVDWRVGDDVGISTFKVREVHRWLNLLEGARHEAWTADETKQRLHQLRGVQPSNRWWRLLRELRSEWAGETGEGAVPVTLIRDAFVEALLERQRAHRTAEGVALVTAHKAKGLEFAHVVVADGGWQPRGDRGNVEEERRVFYVAATRAKETLTVMVRRDQRNPFPAEMTCDSVVDRPPRSQPTNLHADIAQRRYATLGPADLVISYAATCPANSPVHAAIRSTNVGDPVQLVPHGKSILVQTAAGTPIGSLSVAGKKTWEPRLERISRATVSAMLHRSKEQEAEEYRGRAVVDEWEFPIVEVCWNAEG